MAIQILPPQLANQIAAGEVVERPASVVKELVENSLDAGATRVDIEIDKGGAKLIRIQDNGGGIAKEELALALSRHATSKVHTLDDLEAILSFGFRGEALASISSVSRLTLTSRTAEQSEAWLAYAEGADMGVKILPAAHPVGTSIEVVDLFFNTPARRRFLKSDKTEFTHIDEWLKRIALARPEIHLTLKHNCKQVRNYRPAENEAQYLQRLAQVCGRPFAEQALKVECQHDDMRLSGYLQSPWQVEPCDTHYFYVNGRLVRDRLVNHAVRQAFAGLAELEQPGYVLMLELDPYQVDVNVHPAKHEVRFHQARYVHDYILQALSSALQQLPVDDVNPHLSQTDYAAPIDARSDAAGTSFTQGGTTDSSRAEPSFREPESSGGSAGYQSQYSGNAPLGGKASGSYSGGNPRQGAAAPSKSAISSYGALLSTPGVVNEASPEAKMTVMPPLLDGEHWVLVEDEQIKLLKVKAAAKRLRYIEIIARLPTGLTGQPLLMPVAVDADPEWPVLLGERATLLRQLGLDLSIRHSQLIIKKVPPYLRDTQLASLIPELLQWLRFEQPQEAALANWLAQSSLSSFVSAPLIWQGISALDEQARQEILQLAKVLPWQQWLEEEGSE
ncbi:TPA: DNA mismatch repair endonuclease MutL [Shewanella algae]|uniref:DNA mismatch repair endonuclease MutL n=1 Tax=Shewanella algae TaxID=38313 RepID=UPI001C5808C9|nr:DNA mismatch repair endonuclease MutL [Shewanella algae]HDS1198637.1 DNA mismatch repair endonuclease MutL [Shewanella algae]